MLQTRMNTGDFYAPARAIRESNLFFGEKIIGSALQKAASVKL
jgi:hypothetical protein